VNPPPPGGTTRKGTNVEDLRYPIGKFKRPDKLNDAERRAAIDDVAATPEHFKRALKGLTEAQLDTPYREGGWTVRQVAGHVPDSHLNAYIRFKLALTEPQPTIKPYKEGPWSELPDTRGTPVEVMLNLLESLHTRWIVLLRSIAPADWAKTLNHPENGVMNLDQLLALYAWHGKHHAAHITTLRERMKWR
jgi:uncharacterized damage-inducible protein DinB